MKNKNKGNTEWAVEKNNELLEYLFEVMPNKSRSTVKGMLKRGQVTINGKPTTQFDERLKKGDVVTLRDRAASPDVKMKGIEIVYEDDDIIAIEKSHGLLTMGSKQEKKATAFRMLMDYVQSIRPNNRIFIVHRLDRDTSGVMIFAKSRVVQQKLQNNWKDIVSERTYIALVEGQVKKDGTITSWLKEDKAFKMHSSPKDNGGQKAITHYQVMRKNRRFSLLKVNLETGRKNQIRVHMETIGHPIVGDKKYGSTTKPINRLGLHASVIEFKHPTSGKTLRFESKPPSSFTRGFK